jgi:hypothetical protein
LGTASQLFAQDESELTYIFAGQEVSEQGRIIFINSQDMGSTCIWPLVNGAFAKKYFR